MTERLRGPAMLAMVGDLSGPTLWRVLQPFTALERTGYGCGWDFKDAPGLGEIAGLFDGFVLPRMAWTIDTRDVAETWFAICRRAGRVVVYDADDDIFSAWLDTRAVELGRTEGKSALQITSERHERIWCLRQCDGVTVSTQRLATIVRRLTDRPVVVVPNAIDVAWFRTCLQRATRQVPGLTIGWAGGQRPDRDVAMMAEAWGRVARRCPAVTFVCAGYLPPIVAAHVPADRLVALPWLPVERYPEALVNLDIACCAVADEPFNHAKSVIKAYEAALAQAAVVASPTLYGGLIEPGRTGYLASTVDDWEGALVHLVERPAIRAQVARRLEREVVREHALDANLWRWPAAWQRIAEAAVERRRALVRV